MIWMQMQQKYQHYHQLKLIWYVTGEEILQSDQSRIIEEAQFTYPPLGKGFEKQIKAI